MSDLAQGYSASLILNPGDSYRVSTSGTATVQVAYGGPSGTTTLTAQSRDFGPYDAHAKLEVVAVSGTCSYSLRASIPVTKIDGRYSDPVLQSLVSGDGDSSAGFTVCDWQPSSGSLALINPNGGTEAVALDPAVLFDGLPMVRVTQGSTGVCVVGFTFNSPVYLAQMQSLQIPVRFEDNTSAAWTGSINSLQVWLDSDTGTTPAKIWKLDASLRALDAGELRSGATHLISAAPGGNSQGWSFAGSAPPSNTTDLDAATIARVRLVCVNVVSGARAWAGTIRANARRKPVVSPVFDGQFSSVHNYILPMLEAQGLRGSIALQGNQIGQSGRMTRAQLDRAYAAGHEIINWGYDPKTSGGYQNASDWATQASISADIAANRALMAGYGWTRGMDYAVHGGSTNSYGSNVSTARQNIITAAFRENGIKAIRRGAWVQGAQDRLQNMALPSAVDPYTVCGALQWTNTDNAASLNAVTIRAKAKGEWGIITGHRSVVSGANSLEVLNSDLLAWVQALGDDVRSGRVLCLPFGEACRYYGLTT